MTRRRRKGVARRVLRVIVLGLGLVITLPVLIYFILHGWVAAFENPKYADQVFSGILPYQSVLASKKWHTMGDEALACTYAIVDLGIAPATAPPTAEAAGNALFTVPQWHATPDQKPDNELRDPVAICKLEWSLDITGRLARALEQPGSWYWRDASRETVDIYSAAEQIAAHIRWGD